MNISFKITVKFLLLIFIFNNSFADDKKDLIQRKISDSIASYSGKCACPYQLMSNGRKCGKRSAYSKPGGYTPLCYASDIAEQAINKKDISKPSAISKKNKINTYSIRIIDADTIVLNSEKIRLHGIDSPESNQKCTNNKGKQYACGMRSTKELKDIIGKNDVSCSRKDKDRYGRSVSVCYVNGQDINGLLVERGWALAYRKYSKDYVNEENQAKNNNLGLWSGEFVLPWNWRRKNK